MFASALHGRTIVLSSGEIVIGKNLNILGPGATNLAISGNGSSRVFFINAGVTNLIAGLSITNGNGVGVTSPGYGGGILSRGTLTISNTILSGNSAQSGGGGIYNIATLIAQSSTFSGNSAGASGGGIGNEFMLTVQNSTFSGNTATNAGGGIYSLGGTLTLLSSTLSGNRGVTNGGGLYTFGTERLTNCIVAGNFSGNGTTPNDIAISLVDSAACNLIGNAASAGGIIHGVNGNIVGNNGGGTVPITSILNTNLAFNGGSTRTHALVVGSLAINAGTNVAGLPATDQRGPGFLRIFGGTVDIGAYELQLSPPVLAGCPTNVATNVAHGTDTRTVTWAAPTATGSPATVVACLPPSGSLFGLGATLVICTATNFAGTNTCTFTVTVCATNIVVASANDGGAGSLRAAISNACPGGTITSPPPRSTVRPSC